MYNCALRLPWTRVSRASPSRADPLRAVAHRPPGFALVLISSEHGPCASSRDGRFNHAVLAGGFSIVPVVAVWTL